jgi:hypothetical protein
VGRTKSILDMTFIHGTSRFTIADMADSTPLDKRNSISLKTKFSSNSDEPEKLVLVLHELRLNQVRRAYSDVQPLQILD